MATQTTSAFVQTLEQMHILEPAQLQEVTQRLQGRFPASAALAGELVQRGWLTSFQVEKLLAGRGRELQLGPYLLLDRLGQGGVGEVFKARLHSTSKIVALKILRQELIADADAVARFHREMEMASQLRHPCIIRASDAGQVDSALVLEMEYLEGIDLEALVRKSGALPAIAACDYIRQAALGLQHAYKRGLVHRDIKPANLFVCKYKVEDSSIGTTPYGLIKIFDLGLARLQEPPAGSATKNLTQLAGAGIMQGTPDYMAPEQAIDFHSADIRADIYSLGCAFYFLLTGKPPFSGSLAEKLIKHQQTMPPPVDQVRAKIPPALSNVVKKMMAKRPVERYQTPGEVAQALDNIMRNLRQSATRKLPTISPSSSSSGEFMANIPGLSQVFRQPKGFLRRRGKLLAAGGVLLLLTGGLLAWFSMPGSKTEPTTDSSLATWSRPTNVGSGPQGPLKMGEGRQLEKAEQAIEIKHEDKLDPAQLTLTAWIKLPQYLEGRRWIVGKNENEWKQGHYALVIDGKQLIVYLNIGDGKEYLHVARTGDVLQLNRWHQVCLTYDGKLLRGYFDGESFGDTVIDKPRVPGKAPLTIGRRTDKLTNTNFIGRLDDIRLYNRVLGAEEVKTLYRHPDVAVKKGEGGLVFTWP